jgi:hypothetical protein
LGFQVWHALRLEAVNGLMRDQVIHTRVQWSFSDWVFAGISAAMIIAFVVTVAIWAVDPRLIDGMSVWAKPLKFELALAVHAATLAIVASLLGPKVRAGVAMQWIARAFLLACTIEMGWIIFQAAQGQHSHFNESTAFHRAMFSVMAFAAVIITGAAAAVAWVAWRDPDFAAGKTLKTGIILGLIGGTILTLVTAFTIGAKGSPYVGEVPLPTSRMMFTGWSLIAGDLRVSHFLATHMMQAVPLAAVMAVSARIGPRDRDVVLGFAAFWTIWTLIEFSLALSGKPAIFLLLHP